VAGCHANGAAGPWEKQERACGSKSKKPCELLQLLQRRRNTRRVRGDTETSDSRSDETSVSRGGRRTRSGSGEANGPRGGTGCASHGSLCGCLEQRPPADARPRTGRTPKRKKTCVDPSGTKKEGDLRGKDKIANGVKTQRNSHRAHRRAAVDLEEQRQPADARPRTRRTPKRKEERTRLQPRRKEGGKGMRK